MNVDTLKTLGFVPVAYPVPLRERVLAAMASWQGFCALPEPEKRKLSGGDRLKDFGYMFRNDAGATADRKELFHVVRTNMGEFRRMVREVSDPRAGEFIEAINALIEASAPLVVEFARGVEREFGLSGFADEVSGSQDNWTFRYLHYVGGDMLANAHADRGGFTLHLHESHPGGEYFGFDRAWHPWPVSDTQTIIFPSMALQHRSHNALKALWHRVLPTEETRTAGRYSMVGFIDFPHSFRYNDAVKRLQDFPPGFNYDMPWDEFHSLFVPRV